MQDWTMKQIFAAERALRTSSITYAGAPIACACAIMLLDQIHMPPERNILPIRKLTHESTRAVEAFDQSFSTSGFMAYIG